MKFERYENPVPRLEAPALVENYISVNTSSAENYQCVISVIRLNQTS